MRGYSGIDQIFSGPFTYMNSAKIIISALAVIEMKILSNSLIYKFHNMYPTCFNAFLEALRNFKYFVFPFFYFPVA